MKTLKTNNEMNYKVLFESAMDRIAELEQELEELKATLTNNEPIAEPTDATQVIRKQIISLLKDNSYDVIDALVPIMNDCEDRGRYVLNDEKGLEYVFRNIFNGEIADFTSWLTDENCYFGTSDPYLHCDPNGAMGFTFEMVFDDLIDFVKFCPDEALDRILVVLDELQLW